MDPAKGIPQRDSIRSLSCPVVLWKKNALQCSGSLRLRQLMVTCSTEHYRALQSTAEHYRALQSTTEHYRALRSTTEHYRALQSTTEHYRALQNTSKHYLMSSVGRRMRETWMFQECSAAELRALVNSSSVGSLAEQI